MYQPNVTLVTRIDQRREDLPPRTEALLVLLIDLNIRYLEGRPVHRSLLTYIRHLKPSIPGGKASILKPVTYIRHLKPSMPGRKASIPKPVTYIRHLKPSMPGGSITRSHRLTESGLSVC